jgi:hypothetical protein
MSELRTSTRKTPRERTLRITLLPSIPCGTLN